ncbi:hypothetical protein CCS79_12480 [Clostridium diolis]|uniref:O-antigen ligase family protein n=1 Tax=Clostridium diolis TaxID=223919 RepID=UPI000B3FE80B|nr:O-antigen ligase family protein [Clostridium diolis]OVE67766.1 hypothetical protein CCS79_12480 [Clostridium diolis]
MIIIVLTINKKDLLAAFAMLVLLCPPFLTYEPSMASLMQGYKFIEYIEVIILLTVTIKYKKYFSWSIILVFLYTFFVMLSQFINGQNFITLIGLCAPWIGLCLLANYLIKENITRAIKISYRVLYIYCLINLITMLFFPDGMVNGRLEQATWFLGNKNVIIVYVLPCMFFCILNSLYKYNKVTLHSKVQLIICSLSIFISQSATSIVGIVAFLLVVFLEDRKIIRKVTKYILNYKIIMISIFTLFFMLVISRDTSIFSFFIVDVLNRTTSFTGRNVLWDQAIALFQKSPYWGVGDFIIYVVSGEEMVHAHDIYLDILARYGIFTLITFITFLFYCVKCASKGKNAWVANLTISIILIISLFEVYSFNLFFYTFIFMSYLPIIDELLPSKKI